MKNNKYLISAILLLSTFTGSSFAQISGTKAITFKKESFDQSLTAAVGPSVMGYQYVLIKGGQVVTEKAGGKAQTSADGNVNMTINTPTNIGSLAKFLSGTALLNMMEKPTDYALDKGKTLSQRLDRRVADFFPNVWKLKMRPGIEKITLRQLLQHRTGFDNAKPNDRTVLGFLHDADGFSLPQYDQREYSNINFAFVGYMIPFYEHPGRTDGINKDLSVKKLNEADSDKFARDGLGNWMHTAMKNRIWDKMKPKIEPNCDASNALKDTAAYGYNSRIDPAKGFISSMIVNQGHCGGHGGYFLSARDFANYVAHFEATDLIVTKEARDLMGTEGMASNDRLVWTMATKDPWINTNFKMPNVFWSNGITGGFRSVLIRLPQDYYVVLFTNSPEMNVNQLYNAGVAAFKAGMQHNF